MPCIWIGASHDVRENRFLKEHPESLLVKRPSWCGDYWFDPTNPDYLNSFIPEVFSQLTEKWGYGAIKWDALPRALDYFDQYQVLRHLRHLGAGNAQCREEGAGNRRRQSIYAVMSRRG